MEENYSDTVSLDHSNAPKIFRPGEYVLIRIEMLMEDDIAIKNKSARVRADMKNKQNAEITLTMGDSNLMILQRMIVGWNLSQKVFNQVTNTIELRPLPFSPENVRKLTKTVSSYVLKKINEFNADPDEEEAEDADFLPSAADVSGANHSGTAKVSLLK